jgi:FlaA1/EpsC-like NDP-sugar epimerase
VFVLDMGEPVKIVDLAQNMIRLSGKEPGRDIAVDFIGVRPGEKIHEELWADGEEATPTSHPKIFRCSSQNIDTAWLEGDLAELIRLMEADDTLEVVARLGAMTREPKRISTTERDLAR